MPLYDTVPETPDIVKVDVVMVEESIDSLNAAVIVVLIETPVAPLAGLTDETVGAVVSGAEPVVKLHV